MSAEHPFLQAFPELREVFLQHLEADPLLAHLAADYELLAARLKACAETLSLQYQALDEELQTLKDGLLEALQPMARSCCGRCQKVSCSA